MSNSVGSNGTSSNVANNHGCGITCINVVKDEKDERLLHGVVGRENGSIVLFDIN